MGMGCIAWSEGVLLGELEFGIVFLFFCIIDYTLAEDAVKQTIHYDYAPP